MGFFIGPLSGTEYPGASESTIDSMTWQDICYRLAQHDAKSKYNCNLCHDGGNWGVCGSRCKKVIMNWVLIFVHHQCLDIVWETTSITSCTKSDSSALCLVWHARWSIWHMSEWHVWWWQEVDVMQVQMNICGEISSEESVPSAVSMLPSISEDTSKSTTVVELEKCVAARIEFHGLRSPLKRLRFVIYTSKTPVPYLCCDETWARWRMCLMILGEIW